MLDGTRDRRMTILTGGALVALMSIVSPPAAHSGEFGDDPCLDEWIAGPCKASESECADCEAFCADTAIFPNLNCQVEWEFCDEAEEQCPTASKPIWQECACEKAPELK
jgi:hypothetical protein